MSIQLFKQKQKTEEKNSELLNEFEALKSKQIVSLTRTVRLKFTVCIEQKEEKVVSGCGCGGSYIEEVEGDDTCMEVDIDRDVDINSAYKDGDTAHSIKPGDRIVDVDIFNLLK